MNVTLPRRTQVKRIFLTLSLAVMSLSFLAASMPVEAKRLGGGSNSGMKRQAPPPNQAPQATPNTPANPGNAAAAPGAAAAGTAAAAGKRSWMGPIAGLAAGLGIAALMSHLGMGEAFGNFLMMALLAVAAIFLVRFLMRRFGNNAAQNNRSPVPAAPQGMQFAGMPMPRDNNAPGFGSGSVNTGFTSTPAPATVAPVVHSLPAGFDAPAFERIAKLIFIRMQAANDAGNLDDLRQFATPEMFATFKLELQDRQGAKQETDVVQLNAQVLEFVQEGTDQIVSVRFHGLIREVKDQPTTTFDEVWHLVKPVDDSRQWAIAGIAQSEAV
ncbi:MAG: Tim44 domain-containing protein [Burkholderiaceae bacterium]